MKSDQSLLYRVSIILLTLITLLVIAIPADTNFKTFSDSVGITLGRDVSMVSSVSLPVNEGESLFFPEKVEKLLAFKVPKAVSSFIFPRDSSFSYKDGFLVVSDRLANELTRVSLGDEVQVSFEKTDLTTGTSFNIPKLDSDYLVLALTGSTIRNFISLGNSTIQENSKYSSLSPVAVFSDPSQASELISSVSYKAMGDIINDLFSFIYSGDTKIQSRRDELLQKFDQAIANTASDVKIDEKIKNDILAVYANTAGLMGNGAKFEDDRYSNILSGIQVELSNRILRSNKTLGGNTQVARQAPRSLKVSAVNTSQGSSTTSTQNNGNIAASSASNNVTARVNTPAIDPRSLNGIPRLPMPAKAKVGTTSILAPCELTKGYLTHYLQDRDCTGANIISIPMGVFNLIYNSSKPDDSFYGIRRAKTNFDEYITSDLRFFVNAKDQKIPLSKSGASLNAEFVWRLSPFKAVGGKYIREEKKLGAKYIYAKVSPSDTKFRLVEVLLDNSKIIGLQFKSISPFDLVSIEYRRKKDDKVMRKVTLTSSIVSDYGTQGVLVSADYPNTEDVFKDVGITSYHGNLFSITIGTVEKYEFNSQGIQGNYYPIAMRYYKYLPSGQVGNVVDSFFGYDSDGTKVYSQTNSSNQTGKTLVRSVDYTYPKSADSHNVNYKDNFNKSSSTQYRNFGSNVLKVATSTPFGDDLFQYKPPLYSFYKHYSARDKKWDTEVLKYADQATDVRINNQIKSEREVNGTTTTIIKDLNNKELVKSVLIDKGNGEYTSDVVTGAVKKVDSKTNVVGSANSYTTASSTEVAGKKETDTRSVFSESSVQVNDVLKGRTYKELKVGDMVTQTYTEPNRPVYTKEITSTTSNKIDTTQTVEKVGAKIVSKSVTKTVDEPAGTSWVVDNYVPVEGSTKWRQNSSGYDAPKEQYLSKQGFSPVGGR